MRLRTTKAFGITLATVGLLGGVPLDGRADTPPALAYSTYLGGAADDAAYGMTVDAEGNLYVTGSTNSPDFPNIILAGITASTDFPLRDPIQSECAPLDFGLCIPDIFVTKLDPTGTTILFSTYLGGRRPMPIGYPPDEAAQGVGVDARGDIYLAGWTYSADFPTAAAVQPEHGGGTEYGEIDAFAARIAVKKRGANDSARGD